MVNLRKNPLNQAVGALIARLRNQKGHDVANLANELGLSSAYVRQIESGLRTLPPYTTVGLITLLGMTWTKASTLLALVSYLDTKDNEGCNYSDMLIRLEKLRRVWPKGILDEIFDTLESVAKACSTNDDAKDESHDQYISALALLTDSLENLKLDDVSLQDKNPTKSQSGLESRDLASYRMSPFFEDIVDKLASQLAMFPPHINQEGMNAWERKNKDRICELYGFISDKDSLINSLTEFDWSFLWNSHRPNVKIFVESYNSDDTLALEREFREKLARRITSSKSKRQSAESDIDSRVHLVSSGQLTHKIKQLLLFDFTSRSLPTTADLELQPLLSSQHIQQFDTTWIYRIKSDSLLEKDEYTSLVGYLSFYDKIIAQGYAVAIGRTQMREIISVFDNAWSDHCQNHFDDSLGN